MSIELTVLSSRFDDYPTTIPPQNQEGRLQALNTTIQQMEQTLYRLIKVLLSSSVHTDDKTLLHQQSSNLLRQKMGLMLERNTLEKMLQTTPYSAPPPPTAPPMTITCRA